MLVAGRVGIGDVMVAVGAGRIGDAMVGLGLDAVDVDGRESWDWG